MAYVILIDVQAGPKGDVKPDSAAAALVRETLPYLHTASILLVTAPLADSGEACSKQARGAKQCDEVIVVQSRPKENEHNIEVIARILRKNTAGKMREETQLPEDPVVCPWEPRWQAWSNCRKEAYQRGIASGLKDHFLSHLPSPQ